MIDVDAEKARKVIIATVYPWVSDWGQADLVASRVIAALYEAEIGLVDWERARKAFEDRKWTMVQHAREGETWS